MRMIPVVAKKCNAQGIVTNDNPVQLFINADLVAVVIYDRTVILKDGAILQLSGMNLTEFTVSEDYSVEIAVQGLS